MKLRTIVCALLGAGLLGAVLPAALATEKEKPSAEVEAKVAQVIKAAYPEVVIISMAKGNEDGLEVVGVAFTSKGNKMDADVTPDGILVGTEEAADIKTFPRAAAVALRKATKGMKTTFEIAKTYAKGEKDASGAMKVVKLAAPIIAYEADVEKDGQKGEFAVDADGKMLESPKWAEAPNGKSEGKKENVKTKKESEEKD